jgi:hypothetical protein
MELPTLDHDRLRILMETLLHGLLSLLAAKYSTHSNMHPPSFVQKVQEPGTTEPHSPIALLSTKTQHAKG